MSIHSRTTDRIIIGFYILALLVVYLIEIEQVVIRDPMHFIPPAWPPEFFIKWTHWWGHEFHVTLWHRPAWYRSAIWIDLFFSGPVYLTGIYAFWKKKEWIRLPALIQASVLLTTVIVNAFEEVAGVYRSDHMWVVLGSMIPWAVMPVVIILRTIRKKELFVDV